MTIVKYEKKNQRGDNKSRKLKQDADEIIQYFYIKMFQRRPGKTYYSKTLAKTELMLKEKCFEELAMTINTNFYLNICLYTTLFHVVLIATSVNKTYCYKILPCPSGHRPGILTCASKLLMAIAPM